MHRPIDETDHRPLKIGQSDLVCWLYRTSYAYTAVLPAELHSLWAACYKF